MCKAEGTALTKLVDVLALVDLDKKSVPKDEMFYVYAEMARMAFAGMSHILANNQQRLNEANKELIDIDHIMEIRKLDTDEKLRSADERITIRQKRRVARAIHNMDKMLKDKGVDCNEMLQKMDLVKGLLYREVTPSEKVYTFRSDRGGDIFERITGKRLKGDVLTGDSLLDEDDSEKEDLSVPPKLDGVRTLADLDAGESSSKPLRDIDDLSGYLEAQKGRW